MNKATGIFMSLFFGLITIAIALEGCKEKEALPIKANEPEKINTLLIEFKEVETGNTLNYMAKMVGFYTGQIIFSTDTIQLKAYKNYLTTIKLFSDSNNDELINVTNEIYSEKTEHIISYEANINSLIIRTDSDGKLPLGLESKWLNGGVSNGNLLIQVMHQSGIKDGSSEIGIKEFEAQFPIMIQ